MAGKCCCYTLEMKVFILLLTLFIISIGANCQTYIALAPSLTNSAGTFSDKSNLTIEIGQQWDVFSLGLDFGKTSLSKVAGRDTTNYIELRPNLNVFQQGKFTNTFTAGIGYVFNAKENLITELTSGIEYAWTDRVHLNIVFGQYFYSGLYSASNTTFFGISVMWYFSPAISASLIRNKQ